MINRLSSTQGAPSIQPAMRDHLGDLLRQLIAPDTADVPTILRDLIDDLTEALAKHDASAVQTFRDGLITAMPRLRNFAISLTRNPQRADDLVQETMVKALRYIDKFEPGSNLDAWLYTILRNQLLSEYRKRQREVEDPDGIHAARVGTPPEQVARVSHQDLLVALQKLSIPHREALLLVGAQGMSYEDTAAICGVAVGTIKSRVDRARLHLGKLLAEDGSSGFDGITSAALGTAASA